MLLTSLGRAVCPKSAHLRRTESKKIRPFLLPQGHSLGCKNATTLARQLGDPPVALIAASATFALNAALCFLRVRFMSCSCATGAF